MPYGYGSANQSGTSSGRDTGSNYGQFDRAVSRAVNNPPASTPSGNGDNYQDRIQRIAVEQARVAEQIAQEKSTAEREMRETIAKAEAEANKKIVNELLNQEGIGSIDVGFQNALRKQQIRKEDIATQKDPNYGQFFEPKPLVEPPKKWYNHPLVKILAQPFLPEPLQRLLTAKTAATTMSDVFADTGLTKTNVARDFMENLSSKFASTGKPRGTIDTKTERGDGRQIEKPTVQEAISKGEGLESGKKLLGLSDEETNYIKKLFASRDRKFLQSIFDKGTTRIQSGKATQKEQDVYTLLQQYLVDPKEGIMGVA
jgi:hypothetical protein